MHRRLPWFCLLLTACTTITELDPGTGSSTSGGAESSGGPLPTTSMDPPSGSSSTTATGLDTTSGDADDTSDSCDFVGCGPDVPSIPECDVWNDDCPRGEKCTYWANDGGGTLNSTRCVPLDADPVGPGEPCTAEGNGFDDCEAGSMCWDFVRYPEGVCVAFCTGSRTDPGCADPGSVCSITGGGLATCDPQCDPLDPQTCPEGQGCYPADSTTLICAPDASGDDGGVFDPCDVLNGCAPGSYCADADLVGQCGMGASRCCTPYCALDAPSCPEGTQCLPLFDEGAGPPNSENVGSCGTP